jgi:hypothetical protein
MFHHPATTAGLVLQVLYLAIHPGIMQVHAYLFGIRRAGTEKTWPRQRVMAGY